MYFSEIPMKKFSRSIAATLALGALVGFVANASASQPVAAAKTDTDNPFTVGVSNGKAKVGTAGTITVRVTAGKGHKPNAEYPNKVKKLSAAEGATLGSKAVRGTIAGKSIVFSIPITPNKAGSHAVTGQVRFSVCNDKQCYIKKVALNATITGS